MSESQLVTTPEIPGQLDERIYDAVGKVALAWSMLERRTHGLLWMYTSQGQPVQHQPSRILIAGMALQAQWDAIEVFLNGSYPPTADVESLAWFKTWRTTAENRLRPSRNDAVHSVWTIDGNDPDPSAIAMDEVSRKARAGVRWDVLSGGLVEVEKLAEEINRHHVDLARFVGQEFRRLSPELFAEEGDDALPYDPPVHAWRFTMTGQDGTEGELGGP